MDQCEEGCGSQYIMSKGLRSKSLRRFRTAKRQVVEEVLERPKTLESYKKMRMIQRGQDVTPVVKKNKFLYPEDENAEIPQAVPKQPLDLRSEKVPLSGLAGPRGRRKFDPEEISESKILLKSDQFSKTLNRTFMDLDEAEKEVGSSRREGAFKSGKSRKYALKKLNKLTKRR